MTSPSCCSIEAGPREPHVPEVLCQQFPAGVGAPAPQRPVEGLLHLPRECFQVMTSELVLRYPVCLCYAAPKTLSCEPATLQVASCRGGSVSQTHQESQESHLSAAVLISLH